MTQIPTLSGVPFLGNIHDIDSTDTHASYNRVANVYGEIFRYHTVGQSVVVVNSHDVYDGVCDERYYEKRPNQGALFHMRNGLGDGLFTSFNDEEAWGVAHRALMPKFGPLSVREMFGEMYDISCQMLSKWARQGPTHPIDPVDDLTRLTLDTIALSAMDSRFNSFYREKSHPFVDALLFFMAESGRRQFRPQFVNDYVYRASTKKYWQCIEIMRNIALQAIKERREHPSSKNDLLNAMMRGKDPKTGKGLTDENIVNNAITFLLAGHETTSGMLSFFFVLINSNPRAYKKAQEEVDTVIGEAQVTVEHLSKLPYITACLREALRLWPTAPGSRVSPKSQNDADYPLLLGKKQYAIYKDDVIQWNMLKVHRDPLVYGEDADQFIPERMLDENFNKLPRNSWKAFGNGMRGCIGKDFAWQEGMLNIAMILQNFDLQSTDPSYTMKVRQSVTLKPIGFTMTAHLRRDMNPTDLDRHLYGGQEVKKPRRPSQDQKIEEAGDLKKTPMTVLYGSNAGTCEALANALANNASSHGFTPEIMPMNSATNKLPTNQPVIVLTSSYEGQPPDNATHFVEWLQNLKESELEGVRFGVFGCGNHDWATTFHKIPKLVDSLLEKHGGHRLTEAGLSDVAGGHVFDDFDHWQDDRLLPSLTKAFGGGEMASIKSHGLDIKFHPTSRTTDLRQDVSEAIVLKNDTLTSPDSPTKKHLFLQLPTHMTYTPGDYLAILPMNPTNMVKQIMARFGLAWDATLLIPNTTQHTSLPQNRPMSAHDLLSAYVELNTLATQKNISTLTSYSDDPADRSALDALTPASISAKHLTPCSLLMAHPAIQLPFGDFLAMLPPLRVRQYSISSSPNHSPHTCTLTYSVLTAPSLSNPAHQYHGTASTYLAELMPGDRVHVAVRPSHASFHLPLDVATIPVIMICAGTGLAPFRGFAQFRHEQIVAGRELAPALLFVGCRHPDRDALHTADLAQWARDGAVRVRSAYSTAPERSGGCRYVQERVWADREEVRELWRRGAKVFVCGSSKVAEGVGETLKRCWIEGASEGERRDEEGAEEWWKGVRNERYASDVFD